MLSIPDKPYSRLLRSCVAFTYSIQRQKEGERRDHLYSKTLYRLCIVLILVSLILCKASHQMSTLIMYGTTSVKNYQTVEINVFNVICIRTQGYGQ